ncbi:hypothetical protein D3C75_463660 [compost metagenome]
MSSVSGSATAQLPVRFVLNREVPNEAAQRSREAARQLAAKRRVKHEVELLSLEYSKVLLERHIQEALDPKTDPRLRRDLRNDVLNRGIGKVTEQPDEDAQKKPSAENFLEFLAGISRVASANEQAQRTLGHTPKDVTPTGPVSTDLEGFFIEVDQENGDGNL